MPNVLSLGHIQPEQDAKLINEPKEQVAIEPKLTNAKPTALELEADILKLAGLEVNKDIFVYDVHIEMNGKSYAMHTYRLGDENTEDLVLFHGYGGGAVFYTRMLKTLATKFRVHVMEFVGLGLSSKQKFECTSYEETMDFFFTSIEKWREAVGLETFHLCGHSFGGFIAGQYATKYQHRIKKLSLLSPLAFTHDDEEYSWRELLQKVGLFNFAILKVLQPVFNKCISSRITPYSLTRSFPSLARKVINYYVTCRFDFEEQEANLLSKYLYENLSAGEGSENAVFYLIKSLFLQGVDPLEKHIAGLEIPVDCYYGDHDHMDSTGAQRLYESGEKPNFEYKIVSNAAHQLTVQNPVELAEEIVRSA